MTYETLTYDLEDGVATLTLNRPDSRNAINSTMSRELPLAWQQFEQDNDARVAIVTGAGDKALCTGADLGDLPETDGEGADASPASIRWTSLQNQVWKPVICAVNGMAVGGGLHFVADSDIVIAAASATFFDTHVKVGLVAGLEPVCLARKMPMEAVLRMMMVGGAERMSAQRAFELGLVGEIVSSEDLLPRARQIADMIKLHSPAALKKTKQAIWQGADVGLNAALENAWSLIMSHNEHADLVEGGRAFMEGRRPNWQPYGDEQ